MQFLKELFGRELPEELPPSDSPPDLASELIEAEKMADEMVDYLLSDRLFWQIVVETPTGTRRPKMTLGSQYERIQHLSSAKDLGESDASRLQVVREAWETARRRYPEQFKDKLNRELNSYLKNWKYFLDSRARDPERWKEDYEVELRNRQRVEEVLYLLGPDAPPGLLDELSVWESEADAEA